MRNGRGGDSKLRQVSAYELHAVDFGPTADKVAPRSTAIRSSPANRLAGFDYLGEPTPYYETRSSRSCAAAGSWRYDHRAYRGGYVAGCACVDTNFAGESAMKAPFRPGFTRSASIFVLALLMAACTTQGDPMQTFPTVGRVTAFDPAFHNIVAPDARIEKLAEGYTWAEGPAWIADGGYLLFTDVPENTLYRWSEAEGASVFLKPSGYDGPPTETLREPGANGLYAEPAGTVLLADSGGRVLARLDPRSKRKTTLAANFEGKRFNSPNDVVRRSDGTVFFTDPPYGLAGLDDSPVKELAFNGVYRLDPDGSVHLLDDGLRRPNGIALSPDERTLYVANSDAERPIWMAYTLDAEGDVTSKRVFADASDLVGDANPGLPDGMAVAADGTVFATGPGGVLVFSPEGRRLGRIETGTAVANCAFGDNGRTLYLASHTFLARVRVQARGLGFPP